MNPDRSQWSIRLMQLVCLAAALPLLGSLAASGWKNLQPVQQLTVFDAHGKRVGQVISTQLDFGGEVAVMAFSVEGITFTVRALAGGFDGNTAGPYWESNNCSGTPFLFAIEPKVSLPVVAVASPGHTVYVIDGPPQPIVLESQGVNQTISPNESPCRAAPVGEVLATPARQLVNLDDYFTPPFSVR